ncbi:MAG: ATP-binding cassette domain-containing protein [Deltaproteobacteria bacterium]|nr:ATP-binding cassette domain-containing protein [Deltaproteobacteria bacterium]
MINLHEITKVFEHSGGDRVVALNSVSAEIKEGEFVTIVGTNGSGKSTLLNVIAGQITCGSGKILLDGKDVTRKPEYKRANLIGRVFQNPFTGTSPNLSALENLRIAELRGQRRGLKRGLTSSQRKYYQEELKRLEMGLEERLDATVGLLSGGQRQALTLLMATIRKPKILLLDEHTAALDPKAAEQIVKLTKMIVEENHLTTVMITHSMSQALDLGERTIMMHKGEIIGDFSGEERERMKVKDLLDRFSELRKEELLDDELISMLQEGYY